MAELEAIGITSANLAASLRFYGLIGVDVPSPDEDHVEAPVHGGVQLIWDTEEVIRQIEPDLPSPVRPAGRAGLRLRGRPARSTQPTRAS